MPSLPARAPAKLCVCPPARRASQGDDETQMPIAVIANKQRNFTVSLIKTGMINSVTKTAAVGRDAKIRDDGMLRILYEAYTRVFPGTSGFSRLHSS